MSKAHPPELKKFMDKRMCLQLNGARKVSGILRGFDPFMNLVIDECVELRGNERQNIGMVVIRGNSIIMLEALERVV
ncbi:small nuclear ribonucleoprotein G-like [Branchiostoma lanceolatum]|uniref:Small nuclear ribonucleoprotein G n=1 Tax=Branchiostoma lanceolatum TaxID=7740 RepID=A0A8J9ZSP2_BRALA|nr:SNRPG [Branchiostoma lanceolatum]